MAEHPRHIKPEHFHNALVQAGVIRDGENFSRIVIVADAGDMTVRLYLERTGDERLLNIARSLEGVEVIEAAPAAAEGNGTDG